MLNKNGVGADQQKQCPAYLSTVPLLNDQLIQAPFLGGPFEHALLDAILGDEAEDVHLLCLSNRISMIHSLQISLWIPKGQQKNEPRDERLNIYKWVLSVTIV